MLAMGRSGRVALPMAAARAADPARPPDGLFRRYQRCRHALPQGVNDTFAWVNKPATASPAARSMSSPIDYGYQAPRAVSQYQSWSRDRVVGIMGWGTADTEALVRFVTRDKIPYVSGSYSAALTDAGGKSGRQGVEATPYNFFYGPSYSDALRAMLQWAAQDWKAEGQAGQAEIRPYGRQPSLSEFAEGGG